MISSDEQNISALLALLVDLLDRLIRLCDALNGGLVHTSVTDHVRRGKVEHDELKFTLLDALARLVCDGHGAHLGLLIVGGNLGGRNHIALLILKLLLDAAVEKESNMGVLFGLSNVALLDALLGKPLREHIVHLLRRESNWVPESDVVLGHGAELDVLGVREVGLGRAVRPTQKLGHFPDTI